MAMQLTLRPAAGPVRPACAAFLRGADAGAWLRELGRWGISPAEVACYVVPESVRSRQPAGLLVVHRTGTVPADCLELYGAVADRLLVPVDAELWPATTPAELAALLLWPRQLLHPGIGLVGFGEEDEISLETLLALPPAYGTAWNLARPGQPAPPRLRAVRVLQPPADELLSHLRDTIGTQPLTDIPKPAPATTPAQRLLDTLGRGALQGGLKLTQGLAAALGGLGAGLGAFGGLGSGGLGPGGAGEAAGPAGPGPLERLQHWMEQKLDGLDQKRQNEVQRLLQLFNDDPQQALRYAIPLAGPYLNRGVAPPSAHLGPRSTRFDLGRLGGGGAVDSWDVGQYEQQLRQQYRRAAEQAREAGRYEQAAYIYAHLLADFLQAAKVLEQGRYFREAAALHRDHLNNLPGAAECLERGGLLLESAELRAELQHHEQAGDLYQQLGQPEVAARHFERAAAVLLEARSYPEAARLLHHKLHSPARAQEALLNGWHQNHQAETCLRQYLAVAATRPGAELGVEIRQLYRQHTRPEQHGAFLQVLVQVQQTAPEVQPVARELAYHIISTEALAGRPQPLALLHHFQPTDRLLATDASRYLTTARAAAPPPAPAPVPEHLDPRVSWYQAVAHRNQFLALGRRDNRLHLARGNWYGHVEYFNWPDALPAEVRPQLLVDAYHSTNVVLHGYHGLATQYLAKNKHFDEALLVVCPRLPDKTQGLALLPDDELAVFVPESGGLLRQHFTIHGVPKKEVFCAEGTDEARFDRIHDFHSRVQPFFQRNGEYHGTFGNTLVMIDQHNELRLFSLEQEIQQFILSFYQAVPKLAVLVDGACAICNVSDSPHWEAYFFNQQNASQAVYAEVLAFVGTGQLAVAGGNRAVLYDGEAGKEAPLASYETKMPIVAILPTNNRRQFALLEANGRLTRCDIPAES